MLGAENPAAAQARTGLGDRLTRRGRAEEALPLHATAHEALLKALPAEHPHVHRTRIRMAEVAYLTGRMALADSLLRAARTGFTLEGAVPEWVALHDTLRARLRGG